MPALIIQLIPLIAQAIAAAPQVAEIVTEAKNFISSLVKGGVITADQQNQVHAHIDAIAAAVQSGQTPPEFMVEADPS